MFAVQLDSYRKSNWSVTFIYGYPDHHLQRQLRKQINIIQEPDSKPWLILGELNELSSLDEEKVF